MSDLLEFYYELQRREEFRPIQLVYEWDQVVIDNITTDFIQAMAAGSLVDSMFPIRHGSTNQSIGNQVEKYFIEKIQDHLKSYSIEPCSGAGYPDRILQSISTSQKVPLEFKATSSWNPKDSNRRVLTSSSKKLRCSFSPPIYHLLATIIYDNSGGSCHIKKLRLDFLEPITEVNIRLEASVNHKILSQGKHNFEII